MKQKTFVQKVAKKRLSMKIQEKRDIFKVYNGESEESQYSFQRGQIVSLESLIYDLPQS